MEWGRGVDRGWEGEVVVKGKAVESEEDCLQVEMGSGASGMKSDGNINKQINLQRSLNQRQLEMESDPPSLPCPSPHVCTHIIEHYQRLEFMKQIERERQR